MKKSLILISGVLMVIVLCTSGTKQASHANGVSIVGQSTGCSCHKGKSGSVSFSLGTTTNTIVPGKIYPITFVYNVAILNKYQFWGLDLKASSAKVKGPNYGALAVTVGNGMVVSSGEVVHSAPIDGGATAKSSGTYSYPGLTYNTTGLTVGSKVYFSYGAATGPTGTASSGQVYDQVGTDTFTVVSGMPVEFASFNATLAGGNKVNLNWKTATETNSNHFEIERSLDEITYSSVSKIAAAGGSTGITSYATTDEINISGEVYYRIKEVDNDGSMNFSKVSAVKLNSVTDYVKAIYPNPAIGSQPIHVKYLATENAKLNIDLYTCFGKKISSLTTNAVNGENDILFNSSHILTSGIYYLTVTKGNEKIAQLPLTIR